MSWWTNFRDKAIKFETVGMLDPKKTRRMEADQRHMINDQIKAYKQQTELTRQELDKTRAAQETEKRKIEEKQIRALRRNYRAAGAGLLGVGNPATADMSNQLGG